MVYDTIIVNHRAKFAFPRHHFWYTNVIIMGVLDHFSNIFDFDCSFGKSKLKKRKQLQV